MWKSEEDEHDDEFKVIWPVQPKPGTIILLFARSNYNFSWNDYKHGIKKGFQEKGHVNKDYKKN